VVQTNSNSFKRQLEEVHWDFANVENSGIHLLHWYPATFVAAIPGSMVPLLTEVGETVLDPFCGSGASGIEAVRLGRRFIGFDVNPVAVLITQAKLLMIAPSELVVLRRKVQNIQQELFFGSMSTSSWTKHPNAKELARWYHPETLEQLFTIQNIIEHLKNSRLKIVGRCVFSSILKAVSSQGRHWGWVCDNVVPKRDEIRAKDAVGAYLDALTDYAENAKHIATDMTRRGFKATSLMPYKDWDVQCGDALNLMSSLTPSSVQSIITSPPYYGVADYVKSQRLTFLWYEGAVATLHKPAVGSFEELRSLEVGSRSHRHRNGSHSEYISYLSAFFDQAHRVLKKNGTLCLVLGESTCRPDTVDALRDSAKSNNLIEVFASKRGIKATRRRIRASLPSEHVLVYQKLK
jgi:DNA modification methylase